MEWAEKIESEWDFVDVVTCQGSDIVGNDCVGWTANELALLYEVLSEYILSNQIDNGNMIYFIRTESDDYAGLTNRYERLSDGYRYVEIRLSDKAWSTPPGLGVQDTFDFIRNDNFFKGTIAHELTHAAVWFHPELMDKYRDTRQSLGFGANLLVHVYTGTWYNWDYYDKLKDDPATYALMVDGEWVAMGVSASMYDGLFGAYR